jgi:F-type H+-transporting ATPase subunit c
MKSVRLVQKFLMVAVVIAASSNVVFAQEAAAAGTAVLHYFGAAIGLGLVVIGAGLGIGRLAAAAAEGVARQPAAVAQITGAVNLPLFLLEGVAILAEVFVLLIVLLR